MNLFRKVSTFVCALLGITAMSVGVALTVPQADTAVADASTTYVVPIDGYYAEYGDYASASDGHDVVDRNAAESGVSIWLATSEGGLGGHNVFSGLPSGDPNNWVGSDKAGWSYYHDYVLINGYTFTEANNMGAGLARFVCGYYAEGFCLRIHTDGAWKVTGGSTAITSITLKSGFKMATPDGVTFGAGIPADITMNIVNLNGHWMAVRATESVQIDTQPASNAFTEATAENYTTNGLTFKGTYKDAGYTWTDGKLTGGTSFSGLQPKAAMSTTDVASQLSGDSAKTITSTWNVNGHTVSYDIKYAPTLYVVPFVNNATKVAAESSQNQFSVYFSTSVGYANECDFGYDLGETWVGGPSTTAVTYLDTNSAAYQHYLNYVQFTDASGKTGSLEDFTTLTRFVLGWYGEGDYCLRIHTTDVGTNYAGWTITFKQGFTMYSRGDVAMGEGIPAAVSVQIANVGGVYQTVRPVSDLTVASNATKTSYYAGETYNSSGLTFNVAYANSSGITTTSGNEFASNVSSTISASDATLVTSPSLDFTHQGKQSVSAVFSYGGVQETVTSTIDYTPVSSSLALSSTEFVTSSDVSLYLAGGANVSGLRFYTTLNQSAYNALVNAGYTVKFGTMILPADYLTSTEFTLGNFTAGTNVLKIESTFDLSQDPTYSAAIVNLFTSNYTRNFVARGYVELTKNGQTVYLYSEYDATGESVQTLASAIISQYGNYAGVAAQYGEDAADIIYAYAGQTA